jgi:hypothetical protein
MNPSATVPLPMTDLGRLLSGRNAESNLTRLTRALADEELRVRSRLAAGLNQDDYARANRRVLALQHAQSVLKSLQIFLAP